MVILMEDRSQCVRVVQAARICPVGPDCPWFCTEKLEKNCSDSFSIVSGRGLVASQSFKVITE